MNRFDLQKRLPLSLKCGHSLCEACAKELCKDRPVRCPFDKKSADCSSTDQMGKNFVVMDLVEAVKAIKPSFSFGERPCATHQSELVKFFCTRESSFICAECLLEKHLGHEIIRAKPLLIRDDLMNLLYQVSYITNEVKEESKEILGKLKTKIVEDNQLIN